MNITNTISIPQKTEWGGYTLFSLKNETVQVDVSDLGASIINFYVLDKNSKRINIVLGYDTPEEYLKGNIFLGAVVGPWANRIKDGIYQIDDIKVALHKNEGNNHLHGAGAEIHKKRWQVELLGKQGVTFTTKVKRGEGGYPANLEIFVTYRLTDSNELVITYGATSDRAVPINLTQHSYFNLNGGKSNIKEHLLSIDASEYLAVDSDFIPEAKIHVGGTPMDFRFFKPIGKDLDDSFEQLQITNGYDHCYCFSGNGLRAVAWVYEPESGISLDVITDQDGLQLYTGNMITNERGRTGKRYQQHDGFCLEAQCFPNQINMPAESESCVLRPGEQYQQTTIYQVSNIND